MSDPWEESRQAIADKLDASAGCRTAGLRRATTRTEETGPVPLVVVLEPAMSWDGGTAQMDQYTLTIPAELLVPRPAGRQRAQPVASAIARAAQVEFRSAFLHGQPTGAWSCQLVSWEPDLEEYRETDMWGGRLLFEVRVQESVSRTSD